MSGLGVSRNRKKMVLYQCLKLMLKTLTLQSLNHEIIVRKFKSLENRVFF